MLRSLFDKYLYKKNDKEKATNGAGNQSIENEFKIRDFQTTGSIDGKFRSDGDPKCQLNWNSIYGEEN